MKLQISMSVVSAQVPVLPVLTVKIFPARSGVIVRKDFVRVPWMETTAKVTELKSLLSSSSTR